ncbi:MAG: BadF/BadG/BcrA/BcrD ATPase family protein [Microbacteriaceae bacterium]
MTATPPDSRPPDGSCYLAVDAGNSKTDALLLDGTGALLAWGRAGTGDIYTGVESATAEVRRAVDTALGALPPGGRVVHAALRLAGVDWPEDEALWRRVIDTWGLPADSSVLNDGFASIRLAALDGVGLSVTAGTHSAFAGRGPEGAEFGMNMWTMHTMGAFALGQEAFRAVGLALLGMAPETVLSERLAAHFQVADAAAVIHARHCREWTVSEADFPRLAPLVTAAAVDGDAVARRIIAEQGRTFADYAATVAARVGFAADDAVRVALNGSVARAPGSPLAAAIVEELGARLPNVVVVVERVPPVVGAALDALAEGGVAVDEPLARRLITAVEAAEAS